MARRRHTIAFPCSAILGMGLWTLASAVARTQTTPSAAPPAASPGSSAVSVPSAILETRTTPSAAPPAAGPGSSAVSAPPTIPEARATPLPPLDTTSPGPLPAPETPIAPAGKPLANSPTLNLKTPVTLDRAVSLALALNPSIAETNAALLTAEGVIGQERASLGPKLGANLGINGYSDGINAYRGEEEVQRNSHFEPSAGAQATLPIDITGYLRAAADEAHFRAIAARLDVNRARNQVVGRVETAFFDVLRAQALVNVARENLRDSIVRRNDARVKFQAQTVAILDVTRAETDVANAQQQLISANSAVEINLSALNNAIGLNVNTPITITDTGAVVQPPGVPPPSVPPVTAAPPTGNPGAGAESGIQADMAEAAAVADKITADTTTDAAAAVQPVAAASYAPAVAALIDEALKTRPEALQGDANIAAAQKGIRYAKRSILPQMSVGLRYEFADQTFGTSVELNNGQAFVGFTVPIIDAGLARSRVQEATGREADAITANREAADSIALDVREAYLNMVDARARVGVANQALAQAREGYLLARIRYNAGVTAKAGVSPLLELSDAQAALVTAENSQVNAVYDYNTARVRLNFAVGRYSYTHAGPGFTSPPRP